ncbi:amidase [Ostreiculturibacter nitratireducens]|uniref:amidase n=1 Tax=Ostreiculturibacter nitratireducens TaxID=3075226 RepID=UPI0031B62F87
MQDWSGMSAAELGRAIGAGEIDPVELAAAFLDRARAHPEMNRIYARLTAERALAEAEAARIRAKAGHRRGPLDGVPVSWKDNYDTAGVATEAGSALLKGRVPERDADVLVNATQAGLVCLGKTHLSELAFSGLGLNPVTATPPNVNDPKVVPGGSSSGAAATVAMGLAPAAIGSDTGGSVRIPAAWQDLVGLKTTLGRLSCRGVVPLVESFDTVGPLTKTVEDAALLLAALEGGRPADLSGATLEGVRLLVLEGKALEDLDEVPRAGFESAVSRLEAAGARIDDAKVAAADDALGLSAILYTPEAYGIWRTAIEASPEKMFPPILERFRSGAGVTAADFVTAWRRLRELRADWAKAVAPYDAVILPTAPIAPPETERLLADSDFYVRANLLTLRNTRVGNLMEVPALTLPTGLPSAGIMFLGRPMQEERLLRLGAAAEAALA